MKKIQKITALLLSVLTTASIVGCKKDDVTPADAPRAETDAYVGTHDYTAPDTENFLVKNGVCNYKIVIPENASETILSARDEFVCLFQKATGLRLATVKDTALEHNATNQYISIGETKLLSSAGIEIDKEQLGLDGCRIETKDRTVYIYGGSDHGSLFSVYTFMQVTFDYEVYYKDCIEIQTNVKNKALKAYNVTDIPDFAHRSWQSINVTWELDDYDESMFPTRLRYKGYRRYPQFGIYSAATEALVTTPGVMNWLPMSVYNEQTTNPDTYHPKWYSTDGEELCYNARGDEDEYNAMIDQCVDVVIKSLELQRPETHPNKRVFAFLQCDNQQYCRCDTCQEEYDKYGTMAGLYLEYVNDLAAAVEEELKDEKHAKYRRDNLQFEVYAYSYTTTAPATYNASTGEWESLITLRDDVIIEYAPGDYDFQLAFTDEINDNARGNFDAWEAVIGKNKMYYYLYDTNYGNKSYMYDSFDHYTAETFAHYASKSNIGIFFDSPQSKATTTAWNNLKQYLKAKLSWNTSLDTGELIDNYFNAMYKEAAPMMKTFFTSQRMYWQNILIDEYGTNGGSRPNLANLDYWPIATLEGWLTQCETAKAAVARYKTADPATYDKLCAHIEAEAIAVLYILMDLHGKFLSEDKRSEYIDRLTYDANVMGYAEMPLATSTLSAWLAELK